MSDPVRHRIVEAVAARLRQITVANGYATNAGELVYDWFPENLEPNRFPLLVLRDSQEEILDQDGASTLHRLRLEIIGLTRFAGPAARELRRLIGDVVKALRTNPDQSYGGFCDQLDIESGGALELEQYADAVLASVSLSLLAIYTTPRDDWSVKR